VGRRHLKKTIHVKGAHDLGHMCVVILTKNTHSDVGKEILNDKLKSIKVYQFVWYGVILFFFNYNVLISTKEQLKKVWSIDFKDNVIMKIYLR